MTKKQIEILYENKFRKRGNQILKLEKVKVVIMSRKPLYELFHKIKRVFINIICYFFNIIIIIFCYNKIKVIILRDDKGWRGFWMNAFKSCALERNRIKNDFVPCGFPNNQRHILPIVALRITTHNDVREDTKSAM